jgi:hypothetical protein
VEEVDAVLAHHRLELGGIGAHDPQAQRQAAPQDVDQVMGLLGKPAGVQGDHVDVRTDAARHIHQDHRLRLEAGDDRHALESLERPGEDALGGRPLPGAAAQRAVAPSRYVHWGASPVTGRTAGVERDMRGGAAGEACGRLEVTCAAEVS